MIRALIAIVLTVGACTCGDGASGSTQVLREAEHSEAEHSETEHSAAEHSESEGRRSAARPEQSPSQHLTVQAEDGTNLVGNLWLRPDATATVVLVHQLGAHRTEWAPFREAIADQPWNVLAIDLRGHGESTNRRGAFAHWRRFRNPDWQQLPRDLQLWNEHLRGEGITGPLALVGSSIGASAVLLAARGVEARAVIALSPGLAYRGLRIDELPEEQPPILAVAASGEAPSVAAARHLETAAGATVRLAGGSAHGVRMAADAPTLWQDIAAFLEANLGEQTAE